MLKTVSICAVAFVLTAMSAPSVSAMPVTVRGQGQQGIIPLVVIPSNPAQVRASTGGGRLTVRVRNADMGAKAFAISLDLLPVAGFIDFRRNFTRVFQLSAAQLAPLNDGQLFFGVAGLGAGPGTRYNLALNYNAVPEPASLSLLAIGSVVVGGAAIRRRRRRSAKLAA